MYSHRIISPRMVQYLLSFKGGNNDNNLSACSMRMNIKRDFKPNLAKLRL